MDKIHILLFSSSGLSNVPGCQVSRFSLIYTAKRASTEKVRFFLLKREKKNIFPFSVSQDLKMLGQRESFHFLWSPYKEGVTFMPVLVTGRRETGNTEWPGFPEVSRDWKWLSPWRNEFLGNKQDSMLGSAQFRELKNWRFTIFSQCPCLICSVSTLAKHTDIYRETVLISGSTDYIPQILRKIDIIVALRIP